MIHTEVTPTELNFEKHMLLNPKALQECLWGSLKHKDYGYIVATKRKLVNMVESCLGKRASVYLTFRKEKDLEILNFDRVIFVNDSYATLREELTGKEVEVPYATHERYLCGVEVRFW